MNLLGHWTGEDAYRDWIDRGGGFTEFEWKAMNVFDRARWEQFADRLNEQHRGAVEEAARLRDVLRAVLIEPDPIKRNQLAAPMLTNAGGSRS